MENTTIADNAVHGVTDTAGVKGAPVSYPDGDMGCEPCAADTVEKEAFSAKFAAEGAIETADVSENDVEESGKKDPLEAEFEALIDGKFRDVYRRRTESIIRKRLRSGKARPDSSKVSQENAEKTEEQTREKHHGSELSEKFASRSKPITSDHGVSAQGGEKDARGYEIARQRNKNRPIENGLSGSCGIVTKINVSALDGEGVLSILRRVGAGEKISFK